MSTQFRSRIKSAVTYAQENGATGACCLPDGSKLSGDDVTFYTCNQQNGFFRQGDPDLLQCPDRGLTGCCCACSNIRDQYGTFDDFLRADFDNVFSENTSYYGNASALGDSVNSLGLKDNVTQCECFNRRGKWFYGKCNEIGQIESLCGHYNNIITNKELYDVRFPAACCHGSSGDPGSLECTEVCTEKECSDLAVGGEELPFSLYNGIQSGGDGLLCEPAGSLNDPPVPPFDTNINCSVDAVQGFERQAQTQGDLLTDIQLKIKDAVKNNLGNTLFFSRLLDEQADLLKSQTFPCLELETVDNELVHKCSQKTIPKCRSDRGFVYPRLTDNVNRCSDVTTYLPKRGPGGLRYIPATTSSSNMPEIGTLFQGGIYAGVFEPGVSLVKRQKNKIMSLDKSRNFGEGASNKKWGIIFSVVPFDPYIEYNRRRESALYKMNNFGDTIVEVPTSHYDGFYNTYGDGTKYFGYPSELYENIRSLVYNGFVGWYVPSIDELSFLYSKFHKGVLKDNIQGILSNVAFGDSTKKTYSRDAEYDPEFINNSKMVSSTLVRQDDITSDGSKGGSQLIRGKYKVFAQDMSHPEGGTDLGRVVGNDGIITQENRTNKFVVPLVQRIYISD